MNWNEFKSNAAIEDFLSIFGGFHDSCIKELYMWTETFVDEDLSMSMSVELDTCIRILFQRQAADPSAIELFFKGVTQFHMIPRPASHDSIILGAKLILRKGLFYWAEDEEWQIDQPFLNPISWIAAKELQWRDVSPWMGKEQRYGVITKEEKQ